MVFRAEEAGFRRGRGRGGPRSTGKSRYTIVGHAHHDGLHGPGQRHRDQDALEGSDVATRDLAYLTTLLIPHRRRIAGELASYGGRIVETAGDGSFLVFGDPVQAANWAVRVQKSHRDDPIMTPLGPLQVKIGMHTGSPLHDPTNPGQFVGHEIDYAARIAALAGGGQITISEATMAFVAVALLDGASPHSHGDRDLRGIGRVPVFELLYSGMPPRPLTEAALAPHNLPASPVSFTGRDRLLDELHDRTLQGGVTILKGEGGNGKTALALVIAHRATAPANFPAGWFG